MNRSNFLLLHKTVSAGQPGRVPLIETSDNPREQGLENTASGVVLPISTFATEYRTACGGRMGCRDKVQCSNFKELMFRDVVSAQTDLVVRLHAFYTHVDTMLLRCVQSSIPRHAETSVNRHGGHYEHMSL
ncbi:hypothetical protein TNCV_4597331 [Trichonephila clavipes]|nr:hypothetical protein TNCV_4597331 [Trichonephila clavipes]